MPKLLSDDAVAKYQRDGYYFPLDILSDAETRELRRKLEEYETTTGGPIQGDLRHKAHLYLTWLNDLIRHPRILDAVEDVLGPNILCWSTSFFIKEASDPSFVSWHQDATYWGLSSPDVMTVWVAFTPANLLNGCMKFMPGSHRQQLEHKDTFDKNNLLSRGQEIAVKVDESKGVDAILKPGQASLHHVLLAHGSEPNKSSDRRIGFAIRYIPTYVKQAVGEKDSATLVRGTDTYNSFEHEPRPTADATPESMALHAAIVGRQVQVLYRGTGQDHFRP
ncbi:MAG: phytanoyl-CoA dioxygenase family protein [Reyranella sp.]|jgi:non-haem Fe2+, alpha-ketoglutarate-dependent halogenase|uniref:phytanoyl-CoA dioxygenase family protein n=1 Tax=Reyranella sp. TaxID=1929291 RepID=UPI000967FC30|nr:phytanoyl-CoA dioxygenase family protein [Reyranella sp.]MBN9538477.1 phytanoyl-CoA dioxygenase family protein [Alphaproteobacteria bacterium]MBR2817031.1 phytanoyl-CoA dioxygenase family protein [Reyranella sp.]OJU42638.1 MAG: phytanoyl-CoA dioxygenase [Alphaproteobacteria bacterium 65-37]